MATAGTGQQKSDDVYEGLNEAQIRFLEYLNEQIKKYDREPAGVDVQATVQTQMKLCWSKTRGWYFCDTRADKAIAR
jgi:hypothetical protein